MSPRSADGSRRLLCKNGNFNDDNSDGVNEDADEADDGNGHHDDGAAR